MNLLHLQSVDENKQAPLLWQRPGYQEAKKELSNLQKSKREEQVPYVQVCDRKRSQNRIDPSLQEYRKIQNAHNHHRRHHHLQAGHQAQHGGVRLHGLKSWQKWHPHSWQDDKWSEQMVNETTSNSRSLRSPNSIQETGATRLKTTSSTLSPSTSKSDCSLVSIFYRCCC